MSTFIIFITTNTVISNSEWVIVVAVSLVLDFIMYYILIVLNSTLFK